MTKINDTVKIMMKTLFTQDHIESILRTGLKVLGTYLISHGMLTAGGLDQFITGGVALGVGVIMSYISEYEMAKPVEETTVTSAGAVAGPSPVVAVPSEAIVPVPLPISVPTSTVKQ